MKSITLAAFAALFIAGGAGIANAEGGAGLPPASETDSASLQSDYAGTPQTYVGVHSYGYVRHAAPVHKAHVYRPTSDRND
jgi:hypothetical protein